MKSIKVKPLSANFSIGIISFSSPIIDFPGRTERAKQFLISQGHNVIFSKKAFSKDGHRIDQPYLIAKDIEEMALDKTVDLIMISTGGVTGNISLDYINYDIIKNSKKAICGFSDATLLLLAIYSQTGLLVFHGPTLLPTIGEFNGPDDESWKSFLKVMTCKPNSITDYAFFTTSTSEQLYWDKEDYRKPIKNDLFPPTVLQSGQAKGILMGGNLDAILTLAGTKFLPSFKESILFIEESSSSTEQTERKICHLKQLGILDNVKGVLIGKQTQSYIVKSSRRTFIDILKDFLLPLNVPVAYNIDCGHTIPLLTLPVGALAELECDIQTENISLRIIENIFEWEN
jgi:muramoyltetrapeptide carboxypeptidase